MELNGLKLPDALVQIVRDAQDQSAPWMTKAHVDGYGDEFDWSQPDIFGFDTMVERTTELPGLFPFDHENEALGDVEDPGFIPYIYDYSKIVAFGRLGTGDLFCLDYRDNLQEPKVIFREGGYWRRVAPNFAAFLELIEPYDSEKYEERYGDS